MAELVNKTYAMTFTSIEGRILLVYNRYGYIIEFKIEATLTIDQHKYILSNIPFEESMLEPLRLRSKGKMLINRAPEDLSFERFWLMYNYKVGKKDRAKKLWDAMSEANKIIALTSITAYNKWLSTRSTARLYPETYLSQERYNNEF